jgi:hypothetical protein
MSNSHVHPIMEAVLPVLASSPSDVTATDPTVAPARGVPQHPGQIIPLPKQTRGGDVRNAPYGPVPAVNHQANQHPVFVPRPDGDAA